MSKRESCLISVFVFLGFSVVVTAEILEHTTGKRDKAFDLYIVLCLAYFAGCFLVVVVHELGHVIAARVVGAGVRQVQVGPIGLSRAGGKSTLFFSRRTLFGGLTLIVLPKDGDPVAVVRGTVLGGPIASVLLTVVAACWFSVACHSIDVAGAASTGFLLACALGLYGSLVPRTFRGQDTDMRLLMRLRKPGPARELIVAKIFLTREALGGVRARDMSEGSIRKMLDLAEHPNDRVSALAFAWQHYSDRGETAEARRYLEEAFQIVEEQGEKLGILADYVWIEMAFATAVQDHDIETAKALLSKAKMKAEVLDFHRLITEAAIDIGEGRSGQAQHTLDRAGEALKRLQRRLGSNIERGEELIERLRSEANAASS